MSLIRTCIINLEKIIIKNNFLGEKTGFLGLPTFSNMQDWVPRMGLAMIDRWLLVLKILIGSKKGSEF